MTETLILYLKKCSWKKRILLAIFGLPLVFLGIPYFVLYLFIYLTCQLTEDLYSYLHKQPELNNQKILDNQSQSEKISAVSNQPISLPYSRKILKVTSFLFSQKTQKEVVELTAADWEEEYFEALFRKEIWKARWINVRYTYAFLAAMWQKSPIGDLIEFVSKIAKQ